jgi:hypothetical protein
VDSPRGWEARYESDVWHFHVDDLILGIRRWAWILSLFLFMHSERRTTKHVAFIPGSFDFEYAAPVQSHQIHQHPLALRRTRYDCDGDDYSSTASALTVTLSFGRKYCASIVQR